MTTTQDEARRIIERALIGKNFLQGASDAAEALADAGLLNEYVPLANDKPIGVARTRNGSVVVSDNRRRCSVMLDRDVAKDTAAAIAMAAADHMGKNA